MGASKGPQAPYARQRPGEAVALLGRRGPPKPPTLGSAPAKPGRSSEEAGPVAGQWKCHPNCNVKMSSPVVAAPRASGEGGGTRTTPRMTAASFPRIRAARRAPARGASERSACRVGDAGLETSSCSGQNVIIRGQEVAGASPACPIGTSYPPDSSQFNHVLIWHNTCVKPALVSSDTGKPVARLGRKATGQRQALAAGLPKKRRGP